MFTFAFVNYIPHQYPILFISNLTKLPRCICVCMCVRVCVRVCAFVSVCVHMYVRVRAWVDVCVRVCACMCDCDVMCIGVYIYRINLIYVRFFTLM